MRWIDRLIVTLLVAATLVWVLLAGKDLGWDTLNHHFYLPFAWASDRLQADFFGAGPQSYQNPLGYWPAYSMVRAAWPSWAVGTVLALIHAANSVLCFAIARRLWGRSPEATLWCALAAALAWLAPVFLQMVGTTSVDPLGSAAVLAAVLCLLASSDGKARALSSAGAGLLLGVAVGIKLSSAVFALAGFALMLWRWRGGRATPVLVAAFVAGGAVGGVASMAWWSWQLWQQFGNPVFPLYNNIFKSPVAPEVAVLAQRFMPQAPWDYLSRLWEMAELKRFVYTEVFLPDLRPLAALALLMLVGMRAGISRLRASDRGDVKWRPLDGDLLVFLAISYVLWIKTSGNGRYMLAWFLLIGVVLARWAWVALPASWARVSLMGVMVAQAAYTLSAAEIRAAGEPWDDQPYLKVHVPERLRQTPFLHLSLGLNTHASLAMFLHPEGRMMNPIGQMSLPMEGAAGAEVSSRLQAWAGRTRVLFPMARPSGPVNASLLAQSSSETLYRFGLDVDWRDCEWIVIDVTTAERGSWFVWMHPELARGSPTPVRELASCLVKQSAFTWTEFEAEQRLAADVYRKVEQACPLLYGPPGMATDRNTGRWRRFYANTDTNVFVSREDGVIASNARGYVDRYLGSVEDVLAGRGTIDCTMWRLATPD